MCGIAGAIKTGNGRLTIASLKKMASGIETRGRHAFGVAWIDAGNHLHTFKSEGKITDFIDIFDKMQGAKAVIMHTRYSTHGDPSNNSNNHPHPVDGGWLVHNGQIPNHDELTEEFDLLRSTECDSEVLGLLVQHLEGTLVQRVCKTVDLCETDMPLNTAFIFNRPNRVVLVKRGNPLVMSEGSTGNVYFSSLQIGLPGKRIRIKDNTVWNFDVTSGTMTTHEHAIKPCTVRKGVKILGSTSFNASEEQNHKVTFEWSSQDEAIAEETMVEEGNLWDDVAEDNALEEMDENLEQFTKARNNLTSPRKKALDALLSASGEAVHDGTQYVNGRKVRYITPDKNKMEQTKKAKRRQKKARKEAKRKAKQGL